eukprot:1142589-Pelagomonas_calceolata.AAC.2
MKWSARCHESSSSSSGSKSSNSSSKQQQQQRAKRKIGRQTSSAGEEEQRKRRQVLVLLKLLIYQTAELFALKRQGRLPCPSERLCMCVCVSACVFCSYNFWWVWLCMYAERRGLGDNHLDVCAILLEIVGGEAVHAYRDDGVRMEAGRGQGRQLHVCYFGCVLLCMRIILLTLAGGHGCACAQRGWAWDRGWQEAGEADAGAATPRDA